VRRTSGGAVARTTDSPLNQSGFSNAEYDRLVADAKAETDPTRRLKQLAQAEKILIEDEAVIAPTIHQGFTRPIRPSVEGLVFPPYGVFVDFKCEHQGGVGHPRSSIGLGSRWKRATTSGTTTNSRALMLAYLIDALTSSSEQPDDEDRTT
jgi:hypothetical protein